MLGGSGKIDVVVMPESKTMVVRVVFEKNYQRGVGKIIVGVVVPENNDCWCGAREKKKCLTWCRENKQLVWCREIIVGVMVPVK